MTSIVSICNMALSNLGAQNISDVDEASTEARACKQFYEPTRDMLLQSYPWRFARKVVALAAVDVPDGLPWAYAFQRPTDCLKIRTVSGVASCDLPIGYDISGALILSGSNPAFLDYTARNEDAAHYPPLFADALAWHLTSRLAMPITRESRMRNEALQIAQSMSRQAEASDANEVRETSDIHSEFMAARGDRDPSKTTREGFRPTDNRDPRTWDDSRFWID